ncbi:hypothetical protein [Arthrobacter sp. TMS2-4]
METSNPYPVVSSTVLTPESSEVHAEPQRGLPNPSPAIAVMASDRMLEALEQAWEVEEPKFTAAECAGMSIQRLRRLCDAAFAALDADFPAWGARDEYGILSAELAIRAQAPKDRRTSAH